MLDDDGDPIPYDDEDIDVKDDQVSKYKVLEGLEYPKGTPHKEGDILKLTEEQAGEFEEGLIELVKEDK